MKRSFKTLFLVVAFGVTIISYAVSVRAETDVRTVSVDAKKNCCAKGQAKAWKERAVKVHLLQGNYVFAPASGAMSKWESDRIALMQGRKPWSFCVLIGFDKNGQFDEYVLGVDQKHATVDAAFDANRHAQVSIALIVPTTVYLWLEDEYENRDACGDNRGTMTISIQKME